MMWLPEHIEALKTFHAEGLSAAQISERMYRIYPDAGFSRNSVISKLTRAGLVTDAAKALFNSKRNRSPNTPKQRPVIAPSRAKIAAAKAQPKPDFAVSEKGQVFERAPVLHAPTPMNTRVWAPLPGSVPVKLTDLTTGACRWPLDLPEATEFWFCACKAVAGRPYCDTHESVAKPREGAKQRLDEKIGVTPQRRAA